MTNQFTYGGRDRVPGISAAVETFENEFLWGPYEAQYISGLTIDGTTRDTGNTSYTHILRAGLMLGQQTASKKLFVWDPTAQDGTEYIWGILKESRSMLSMNVSTDRLTGLIVVGGGLLSNRLIIPGTTAPGIAGNALEYLVREQLRMRFMLNDSYMFARPDFQIHTVTAAEQTAGITLTLADSHRAYHWDDAGGGDDVVITLPATPYKGLVYKFVSTTTGDVITITSGTANIRLPGAANATTLACSGSIHIVRGDGSLWIAEEL